MNFFSLFFLFHFSLILQAKDLTPEYKKYEQSETRLTTKDLNQLKKLEIILVPGILSEAFNLEDDRGIFDFTFLTSSYFDSQLKLLTKKYQLKAIKIKASSKNVSETTETIAKRIELARENNTKVILITHSLGGLALMDYLLQSPQENLDFIEGIIFLQVPFYGSPIATVFLDNPYHADKWLRPVLPFFHTSMETIHYLSLETRELYMNDHVRQFESIISSIPTLTMSGVTNNDRTLFRPAVDVMKEGCIKNLKKKCLTPILFKGPYDESDGMVNLNSSRLDFIDSIVVDGQDHGEPIIKLPLQNFDRDAMTESLLKILLDKINQR